MYRKPGDLKWHGRKPKHQRRTFHNNYYRYPHGDYWRWLKQHVHRTERQETRIALRRGDEPFPHRNRHSAYWDAL